MAACRGGGACGDDVIDYENVFSFNGLWSFQQKDILHVVHALDAVFVGLARCVGATLDGIGADGPWEGGCNAFAEEFTLVVSSAELLEWVKGYGDEQLYLVESS